MITVSAIVRVTAPQSLGKVTAGQQDVHIKVRPKVELTIEITTVPCKKLSNSPGEQPTLQDVALALLDLFQRYPEDIPENQGTGRVGCPLSLMVTRDLSPYARKRAKEFKDPRVAHPAGQRR